jgi:hypothetical protein
VPRKVRAGVHGCHLKVLIGQPLVSGINEIAKSRVMIGPFIKQIGFITGLIIQSIDGGQMFECALRDMLIVELDVANANRWCSSTYVRKTSAGS